SNTGYYFRQCLTFLLSRGLDVNSQTIAGETLLTSLIFKWHPNLTPEIIDYLLKNGADPNLPNKRGGTPLGYTLLSTRFDDGGGPFRKVYKMLCTLIENGGNVNQEAVIPGRRLKNLLWLLVDVSTNLKIEEQKKILELLLEWGVDVRGLEGGEEESGIFGNEIFNNYVEMTANKGDDEEREELLYDDHIEVSSQDESSAAGVGDFGVDDDLYYDMRSKPRNVERSAKSATLGTTSQTPTAGASLKFPSSQVKAHTQSKLLLTTHNVPLSLLKPHTRTSSQSTSHTSPSSPTSNYRIDPSLTDLTASQGKTLVVQTFTPSKPLNAMVYAVQLNRHEMVKILLERIYEFSEMKSLLVALKECGISRDESFGNRKGGNIFAGFFGNAAGFLRHNKGYNGHSEIIKYLLTWVSDNDEKRNKVLIRTEKAKLKWRDNSRRENSSKGKSTEREIDFTKFNGYGRKSLDERTKRKKVNFEENVKSKSLL
ncbi:13654_t:CDS:1, partial [Acaulospora colombiana]